MNYIISKPALFNAISVHKFFDSSIPDTKAGEIIEKYTLRNYEKIAERLEHLYPEYKNVN